MKLMKLNIVIFLIVIILISLFVSVNIQKDVNAFQSVHIQKKSNITQNQVSLAPIVIQKTHSNTSDINTSKNETKNNETFPSGLGGGGGYIDNTEVVKKRIIKQPSYMNGSKTVSWYPNYTGRQYLSSISEVSVPKRGLYPNNSGMTPYTIDMENFDNYCIFDGKTTSKKAIGSYFGAAIDDENNTVYVGMRDSYVYAVDLSNCSKKWEYDAGYWVDGIPVQVDDYIIITMGQIWNENPGTNIVALYKSNGSVKYKYDIGTSYMDSVNVWNNIVFVGGYDGGVRTYFADTQKPFWNITVGDGQLYSFVEGGISVDKDGNSYFGTYEEGATYSIDLNGTLRWKTSIKSSGNGISSTPILNKDESILYIGSNDNSLYGIYTNNGTIKCKYTTNDQINAAPSIGYDGDIYFEGGTFPGSVYAIHPDCTLKWSKPIGKFANGGVTLTSDGMLLATSYNENLYIFNTSNGEMIKNFYSGFPMLSTPQISKTGKIVFTSYTGASRMYILGLNSNTPSLSNVTNNSIGDTNEIITFAVNQSDSLTQIKYSKDNNLSLQTENQTSGKNRLVNLTGLDSNTIYNYSVFVYNRINLSHWTNSSIQNFTTNLNLSFPENYTINLTRS